MTFSLLTFAAKKDLDFKTGKVSDSATSVDRVSDLHIVTIQGIDGTYTAEEKHPWHNECLLVTGDQIKYARDGRSLFVVDTAGRRCKFLIRTQAQQAAPRP
jgi:hypothetical protein